MIELFFLYILDIRKETKKPAINNQKSTYFCGELVQVRTIDFQIEVEDRKCKHTFL